MSEWSRPIRIETLGSLPHDFVAEANEAERAALAQRFGLVAIERLRVEAEIRREGAEISAEGWIDAAVTQSCVATGDDVPATLREPFALRFVPEAEGEGPAAEIELDEQALDVVPYAGGAIDMGEAAAQTLALALDPWPRAPGADARLRAAGVLEEGEAGPFAALKGLLGKS